MDNSAPSSQKETAGNISRIDSTVSLNVFNNTNDLQDQPPVPFLNMETNPLENMDFARSYCSLKAHKVSSVFRKKLEELKVSLK